MNAAADAVRTALVRSLWQEALLALLLVGALLVLRRRTANARYLACGATLALMVALPVATAVVAYARAIQQQPSVTAAVLVSAVPAAGGFTQIVLPASPAPAAWRDVLALVNTWSLQLWSAGVLLASLRFLPASLHVARLRRLSSPADDAIVSATATFAARLGIRQPVTVRVSRMTSTPATIGFFRPLVLLPPATVLGITSEQLQALLAHELAHVRRHDYLVNVLQMLAETVLFYHPAAWWVSKRMRLEREMCCDDVAVELCGDPVGYARALSAIAHQGLSLPRLAVGSADGPLLRRVQRMLGVPSRAGMMPPVWVVAASALLVATMFAGAGAQGRVPGKPGPSSGADQGVLRGRVVDARAGMPLTGASVRAQYITGVERPTRCPIGDCEDAVDPVVGSIPFYRAVTDADGYFEIAGMRPGEYLVAAVAPGYVQRYSGQTANHMPEVPVLIVAGGTARADSIRLEAAGVLAGRVLSDSGEGLSGVEVELLRHTYLGHSAPPGAVAFAQTDESGAFSFRDVTTGEYYVRAYAPASRRPSKDASLAYLVTFLPGTSDITGAQPVLVGSGDELLGLDFPLAMGRTRVVSGRLVDPGGASLATATVHLLPRIGSIETLRAPAAADGRFRLEDVPQGDYILTIGDTADGRQWNTGIRDLPVFDDVTNLELVAGPTASITGRVAGEDGRPVPFDLGDLQVFMEQRVRQSGTFGAGFGRVAANGRFSLKSGGGPMYLRVVGLPARWFVKAVRLDGIDVTDVAFELAPGARRFDIQLTNRVGRLSGMVTDSAGRPLPRALVIAFPADREKWTSSQLIRTTFSHEQGRYDLADLPIIDYRLVAVTMLPQNAWMNPEVLARLWPSGTAVWLDQAGQRSVRLEVVRPPADVLP